jgi:hypothetical protein
MLQPSLNTLPSWQRRTILGAVWSLSLSGLLWLPLHYRPGAGDLPHPLESWLMRWHGLSAPVGLFAAGLLAAGHVRRGWQLNRKRLSGAVLVGSGATLVVTGYALAYLVPEPWRPGAGWLHSAVGTFAFLVAVAHARRG